MLPPMGTEREHSVGPGNPGAFEYNTTLPTSPSSFPPEGGEGIGGLHNGAGNALALEGHVDIMASNVFAKLADQPTRAWTWWQRLALVGLTTIQKGDLGRGIWK